MIQNPLSPLMDQLGKLPGVGEKSAQRLAFFFLSLSESDVKTFSDVLLKTRESMRYCNQCFNISLSETCGICSDPSRDPSQICVVSEPKDVFSIERAGEFKGHYHVLGGLISPLDGVHPEALRIPELMNRVKDSAFSELIFAINSTVQGDATVLYLSRSLEGLAIRLSRLAYGLPMGADIDYTDEMTLQKALQGRVTV